MYVIDSVSFSPCFCPPRVTQTREYTHVLRWGRGFPFYIKHTYYTRLFRGLFASLFIVDVGGCPLGLVLMYESISAIFRIRNSVPWKKSFYPRRKLNFVLVFSQFSVFFPWLAGSREKCFSLSFIRVSAVFFVFEWLVNCLFVDFFSCSSIRKTFR